MTDAFRRLVGGGTTPAAFRHAERDLAKKLGLGHELLTAARAEHLRRGRDWEMVGGLVQYSDAGQERILAALKIQPPAATPTPPAPADSAANTAPKAQKITPAAAPWVAPARGDVRELVCVRVPLNRRVVECRSAAPGGPDVAWVRVKDNHNFRAGLRLPARYLEGDRWELVGRCPRWPGKF